MCAGVGLCVSWAVGVACGWLFSCAAHADSCFDVISDQVFNLVLSYLISPRRLELMYM